MRRRESDWLESGENPVTFSAPREFAVAEVLGAGRCPTLAGIQSGGDPRGFGPPVRGLSACLSECLRDASKARPRRMLRRRKPEACCAGWRDGPRGVPGAARFEAHSIVPQPPGQFPRPMGSLSIPVLSTV
jgi:hypothetical protein